ncbi:MAG: hypothetical protein EAX86_10575 [Candidatus Heimdallarchaeota archaeon]|nr:hypothetical protein [Candidatus Heimdallarchaeota archaeon]
MGYLLNDFFSADSVVVIRAVKYPEAPDYIITKNFVETSFEGECYFVNPKEGCLFTKSVFTPIAELLKVPDLGIVHSLY